MSVWIVTSSRLGIKQSIYRNSPNCTLNWHHLHLLQRDTTAGMTDLPSSTSKKGAHAKRIIRWWTLPYVTEQYNNVRLSLWPQSLDSSCLLGIDSSPNGSFTNCLVWITHPNNMHRGLYTGFIDHSEVFKIVTNFLTNELHILFQQNSVVAVRGMPSSG